MYFAVIISYFCIFYQSIPNIREYISLVMFLVTFLLSTKKSNANKRGKPFYVQRFFWWKVIVKQVWYRINNTLYFCP